MEYYKAKENKTIESIGGRYKKVQYHLQAGELLTWNDLAIRGLGGYSYLFERVDIPKSSVQTINKKRYVSSSI